jgi:hypothetical protein
MRGAYSVDSEELRVFFVTFGRPSQGGRVLDIRPMTDDELPDVLDVLRAAFDDSQYW